MSYAKLRGRIREVYGTQEAFAKVLGISATSLSSKLNNKTDFTASEILKACEVLNVPVTQAPTYFLSQCSLEN